MVQEISACGSSERGKQAGVIQGNLVDEVELELGAEGPEDLRRKRDSQ